MAFGSGSVLVTRSTHDALGRTVETVENYTGGSITATANKTTQFTYDGAGHLLTYKLLLPSSAYQETQYVYGIATSTISSNDLLAQVWHPNKSTGAASSSEADVYDYDAIGAVATSTDRNGTTHTYTNDILGRRIYDWVTAYGSGVDTTIDALVTTYDGQGNASAFLSLDGYAPGNTVFREFNGWGQMTKEYQDHAWYPSGSTPVMQYRYAEMPSGANYSRLDGFEYPSPGEFDQEYDYSGVDDRISRVSVVHLKGDADVLSLAYLGLSTVVYMTNPVTFRTVIGSGTGDGGDQYVGLDRFGRVVDLTWSTGGGGGAVNDCYQYGYDRDGNRLWRDNVQNSAFGELYACDDLNQLTSMQRGTLNGTKTGLTGSASRSQSWSADGAGNFTGVTTDGTSQSRSYNAQNQFTALGSATPTYDANGNLLTDGTWTYTYDAWNRLATATDGTTTVTYRYDALGRRVTEATGGVTTHLYYNQNWQVVEERVGGTASSNLRAQYVWSPVESDVLIYRDRDTNADGELDERLYVQQDVQGNVTALVNTSGVVVERYAYDAYGKATPYTVTWGTPSGGGTQYAWRYLHQGLRFDAADGLYDNRMRAYSAEYMRFLQNDPIGFAAGDPNTYRYEFSNPTCFLDPTGLQRLEYPKDTECPGPDNRGIDWSKLTNGMRRNRSRLAPGGIFDVETENGTKVEIDLRDTGTSNCHGLTFGAYRAPDGRRYAIVDPEQVKKILEGAWVPIDCNKAEPGDIAVWWHKGVPIHSATFYYVSRDKEGNIKIGDSWMYTINGLAPRSGTSRPLKMSFAAIMKEFQNNPNGTPLMGDNYQNIVGPNVPTDGTPCIKCYRYNRPLA